MGVKISKKKLWIIIACVAAALIAAAATVTVLLLREPETKQTAVTADKIKVYWNVDRQLYFGQGENGVSSRTIDKNDGYYHILFSVDGRPSERRAKTLSIVNKIDDNDAMGLVIDDKKREITDIIPLDEISGGYLCRRAYVKEINGTEITVNSSSTFMGDEMSFKVKTTTPVIDVSLQALADAGLSVKLETLEPKDQITVIKDKDGGIFGVYITKRNKLTPIYWNIERQYDTKYKETKRQPDADGVYSILMAMGGEQVTVKCKDKKVVSEIDARGNRSCGLEFDDDGFVTGSFSAARCTGGGSVASWYDVMSIDGYDFVAEKHSQTAKDNGKRITATLDPDCEIYNVSNKFEDHIGERAELRVTDRVQGFSDPTGKVVYLFIVSRWEQGEFYWNAYRMWDSTAAKSTRVRAADGYFHFVMCHNGQVEDIKVADENIANDMDKVASRSMGLEVVNGVAVRFITPGNMYVSQGSWYDIEEFVDASTIHVKKNSVTASDYGREYNISLAEDCKVYNVTETYSDHIGEPANLRLGDRIQAWVDYTGKAKYVYIVGRTMNNPVTAHADNHICEECGQSVNWTPWTSGSSLPVESGHYYLCGDVVSPQASIKANQNVVLCLNGHNIRAGGKRIYATFEENSAISIHDCTGAGKMYSTYAGDLGTTQGSIIWGRYGRVNLYGGTFVGPTGASQANGPVIATNSNVKVTIKNSTVIGSNTSKSGAAIYMGSGSGTELTVENSTVKGGNAGSGHGDAICMAAKSKLFLSGRVVITSGPNNGLYLDSGAYITFNSPLSDGSDIAVTTATSNGKISTNCSAGDEKYFVSNKAGYSVKPSGGALYMLMELLPDPGHVHCVCGASSDAGLTNHTCDTGVQWIGVSSEKELQSAIVSDGDDVYIYFKNDIIINSTAAAPAGKNMHICLNGHTVRLADGKVTRLFNTSGSGSTVSMCDCAGGGKATGNGTDYNAQGGFILLQNNPACRFDLYGGTIEGFSTTTYGGAIATANGTVNIWGGTIRNNRSVTSGGNITAIRETAVNIYGGVIEGGNAAGETGIGGNIAVTSDKASLNLYGGVIEGGNAGSGKGDSVYMTGNAKVSLSGKVTLTAGTRGGLYLSDGAYITLGDTLSSESSIAVDTATANGRISTNYISGSENCFVSDRADYTVKPDGGALYLKNDIKPLDPDPEHVHCVCGATADAGLTAHTCDTGVQWIGVADENDLAAAMAGSGDDYYIYLKNDFITEKTIASPAGKNLHVCLNGHTIRMTDGKASRLFNTSASGSTLSMCDCAGGGKATGNGTDYSAQGAFILLQNNPACRFDLYGGTIEGFSSVTYGGAIATANGTVNIWGGAIRNNRANTSGGNITAIRETVVNIYGGVIEGGDLTGETSKGGNIAITSKTATLNIFGGSINGGLVNAYVTPGGTELNTEDGYTDINAVNGGNIYNAGTMNVGNVTIKDGKASLKGGNIYNEGTLNLNGATVLYGQVFNAGGQNGGGNIYNDGTVNITGGTYKYGYYVTGTQANCNMVRANLFSSSANTRYYISGGNIGGRFTMPRGELHLSGDPVIHMGSSGLVILEPDTPGGYDVKLYLDGALKEGADVFLYARLPDGSTAAPDAGAYVLVADNGGELSDADAENSAKYFGTNIADVEFKAYKGAVYAVPTGGEIDPDAPAKHTHAVFGKYTAAADHGVSSTKFIYTAVATEEELTSAIANAASGSSAYIYLDADIKLTEATKGSNSSNYFINMNKANGSEGKKIFLCLNGHTLTTHDTTADLSVKLMQINASGCEVTICDCAESRGALIGGRKNLSMDNSGGLFYVASGGKLHLYGVDLKDGSAKTGGMIDVMTATADLYGCNLTGGESGTGLIYLGNKNSTLNMYDCTVTGATAGYGVYLNSGAKAPTLSGRITVKDNAAGNIFIPAGATVTFKELAEGSQIYVSPADETAVFAKSDKDYADICTVAPDAAGKVAVYDAGDYRLAAKAKLGRKSYDASAAVGSKLSVLSPVLTLLREAGLIK